MLRINEQGCLVWNRAEPTREKFIKFLQSPALCTGGQGFYRQKE